MSKVVKRVVSIAAPIVGNMIAPGIGGIIGGALGGAISGQGLAGMALGAATGYATQGLSSSIMGSPASLNPAGGIGPVTAGSGVRGVLSGGGMRALANTGTQMASSVGGMLTGGGDDSVAKNLLALGNQAIASGNANAVEDAAAAQNAAYQQSQETLAPYTQQGRDALNRINQIQNDPKGYIENNPFYNTLADDAQRRLLANQAAKGKVGSGGTADALQTSLLNVGNQLINQDINRLQTQATMGQNAATNTANIQGNMGGIDAASIMGQNNALSGGYDQQIKTILALNGVNNNNNRTPTYNPTPISL